MTGEALAEAAVSGVTGPNVGSRRVAGEIEGDTVRDT
jgi:hypothetical protein